MKAFNVGKKVFWGVLFLLGALALIVGQLGYLEGIGFWSILFTVCLIGILVEGIFHRSFGTILFAAAFIAITNAKVLGIEAITPWPVLGAALLGTIGLNIIFPQHDKWKHIGNHGCHSEWKGSTEENGAEGTGECLSGEDIRFEATFCETAKYITSKELSSARLECAFGSLSVYFDNAVLKDGRADVRAECSFGSMVLYVPANWKVELQSSNAFGGTQEKGRNNPDGTNTLYVKGDVSFGSLEIRYI